MQQTRKEFNTRYDWKEKVIHWELCKKLKFDHTTKWYVHKPESVVENKMHEILLDFKIQTDNLILTRSTGSIINYHED